MRKTVLLLLLLFTSVTTAYCQDKNLAWMKGGSLGEVYHVNISPNNKYLLSVSTDNAKIWSLENKNLIKILPSRLGYPNSPFIFSKDGNSLFYGDNKNIKQLDIVEDSVVKKYTGHKNNVYGLSRSTDGKILLSSASDSTCIIWHLTGKGLAKKIKMPEQIFRVNLFDNKTFLADGRKFSYIVDAESGRIKKKIKSSGSFSQSSNNNFMAFAVKNTPGFIGTNGISVYDTSGKLIKNHSIDARGFCLTPSGEYLIVSHSKTLKIYNSKTGDLVNTIKGAFDLPLAVSPDGKWLAANMEFSNDSLRKAGILFTDAVGLFAFKSGKKKSVLLADQYTFRPPAFSNNSRYLATTDLKLWDINTGKLVSSFINHRSKIKTIIADPNNNSVASLSESGKVFVWDSETGRRIFQFKHNSNVIHNIDFTQNGNNIVAYSYYKSDDTTSFNPMDKKIDSLSVSFWNPKSGKMEKEIPFNVKEYYSASLSHDENTLLLSNNGKLKVFDLFSKELLELTNLSADYSPGIYSPHKKYIVFTSYPHGTLAMYDLKEGKLLFTVKAHEGFVRTFSWSKNEKIFVSTGQDDNRLKVWEMPDGKLVKTIKLNKPKVHYGSVSPDGKYFAGSSKNGFIYIWKLENGEIIQSFHASSNYIFSLTWSSDGKFLFEGDSDGTIVAWKTNL